MLLGMSNTSAAF